MCLLSSLIEDNQKILDLASEIPSYPKQAFLPLLIIVAVAAIVVIIIIFAGDSAKETFKGENSVKLAILGPNAAGKTTLWNYFKRQLNTKDYQETEGKIFMSFVSSGIVWNAFKLNNDEKGRSFTSSQNQEKDINISGYDINGNGDFIRTEWEELIDKANMIIFIFSAPKYLNEIDYQRDINQRLQFIKANIDKKTDEKVHGIWLIGSFADKFSDRKASWGKVISIIKTKRYCDISKNNACLNLTKEDELKAYYEKMFKS